LLLWPCRRLVGPLISWTSSGSVRHISSALTIERLGSGDEGKRTVTG
jgi:hypothetical protein